MALQFVQSVYFSDEKSDEDVIDLAMEDIQDQGGTIVDVQVVKTDQEEFIAGRRVSYFVAFIRFSLSK